MVLQSDAQKYQTLRCSSVQVTSPIFLGFLEGLAAWCNYSQFLVVPISASPLPLPPSLALFILATCTPCCPGMESVFTVTQSCSDNFVLLCYLPGLMVKFLPSGSKDKYMQNLNSGYRDGGDAGDFKVKNIHFEVACLNSTVLRA